MFGFGKQKGHYLNPEEFIYYSKRYDKTVTVPKDYPSDGATGAFDVCAKAWFTHDVLCDSGVFDDGTQCSNWQASQILSDILADDCNRWFRKHTWFWATWLFGGGKCRDNNMF
jgi:hypothetical protein